jgi:hypothetical protein
MREIFYSYRLSNNRISISSRSTHVYEWLLRPAEQPFIPHAAKVRFLPIALFKVTLPALLDPFIFAQDIAKIQNEIR